MNIVETLISTAENTFVAKFGKQFGRKRQDLEHDVTPPPPPR